MHSSISNFDQTKLKRVIPKGNWLKYLITSLFFLLIFTTAWELFVRAQGFEPSLDDSYDLWANTRAKINDDPKQIVLLGSSQVLLDFNLEIFHQEMGVIPIQLASAVANPLIYLDDIANNTNFKGTVILAIDLKLSEFKNGLADIRAKKQLSYFYDWTISQKTAFFLSLILDKNLAFIGQDKVKAKYFLKQLRGKDKTIEPPFLFRIEDLNRQGYMINMVTNNEAYQTMVKNYMLPLSADRILKLKEPEFQIKPDSINYYLSQLKPSIDKIRSRGGKVVLVHLPLMGNLKIVSDSLLPRKNFWERLMHESNANFTIHNEDYSTLNTFNCPDWAHLTISDSKIFTKNFLTIFKNLSHSKNN